MRKIKRQSKKTPRPDNKRSKKKQELPDSRVKIHFGKHILPPLTGLFVAVAFFGFFNSGWISARIAYSIESRKPHEVIISKPPAKKIDKNAPAKLYIDSINVTAPIIFSVPTVNESLFLQALHNGVVHYPNTANPGQQGNIVIFGHSSGLWWAPGHYKFIFTLLDKVKIGDEISIDYQGVRYTYKTYSKRVVQPTDLSVLNQGTDNILTLITCTPVGTSTNRLIVLSKQISPAIVKPTVVTHAAELPTNAAGNLPSSQPSFWSNFTDFINKVKSRF